MPLEAIRALVQDDLTATDAFLNQQLLSDIPLISDVGQYVMACGGKRIRPLIVHLSAKALNPQGKQHIELAAVIELIHTATLLHDDVVDNASLRRGQKTAHTIWGNEASVLVGDLLYSRAFQIVVNSRNYTILDIFAAAMRYIAEGEILQLTNVHNPDTTEDFYFEVIQRKTAKLFEIASHIGSLVSCDSHEQIMAMRDFGLYLGIAYQLIDDALDYSTASDATGKNLGNDLAEGKTTLPLIHAMRHASTSETELLRHTIKNGIYENINSILAILESTGAIAYTASTAKHYAQKAKSALANIADTPYRMALHHLTDFVVERTF